MKRRYQLSLVLLAVLLCSSIMLGTSYSLFTASHTETNANNLNTGCFTFTFTEGTNNINLTNTYPISDTKGLKTTPYTFTIHNTCSISAKTNIALDTINTSTLNRSYLKVATQTTGLEDLNKGILSSYSVGQVQDTSTMSDAYIIKSDTLAADETKSYSIWLWMDESVGNDAQGKTYTGKVVISEEAVEGINLAKQLLDNYGGTTAIAAKTAPDFSKVAPIVTAYKDNGFSITELTYALSTTYQGYYVTYADAYTFDTTTGLYSLTNPTTALYSTAYASLAGKYIASSGSDASSAFTSSSSGIESSNIQYIFKVVDAPYNASASVTFKYNKLVSTKDDASAANTYDETSSGMWSASDDYGTSYYYRGKIDNNNVLFGGYCWKVIRINGNGTTRMIYNGTPTDGKCTATGTATQIGTNAFNTNCTDNAYVGYMYGTVGSSTYDATHANTNSSTIKTVIDTWYNTNLSSYADKISDTEFCNDRSIASAAATWKTDDTALGYGTNKTYYGAYNRIVNNNAPILTCPNKHDRFTVDDTGVGNGDLTYPISLITIDEVEMAGVNWATSSNTAFYLYTGSWYWTVSALGFSGTLADEFDVSSVGNLDDDYVNSSGHGVRPVINLNTGTLFTSGDGTSTNPFVIS
jgi:hypothetical protein